MIRRYLCVIIMYFVNRYKKGFIKVEGKRELWNLNIKTAVRILTRSCNFIRFKDLKEDCYDHNKMKYML